MTREEFQRLEQLFHAAHELPGTERDEFVRQQSAVDPSVANELEALLAAYPDKEESPPSVSPQCLSFGPYKTEVLLGRGGSGVVYRARRADGRFDQQVAVKVLLAPLAESFDARFRTEAQFLAQLDHPHITRLLDSGVTPDGQAYIVMEYVEGQPLDAYADNHRLSINERLHLFLQICDAVSYAHRNLIVHRDLKPSNILVNREGQVKLLDFGTAKLLGQTESLTVTGTALLTPRYASPEQIRGELITTVSDVYSLGVVLHELLSGVWPFGERDTTMPDLRRLVEDRDSEPLGTRLGTNAAAARQLTAAELRRQLSGDLRLIAAKALREDPQQRYASADALADDLRAYLDQRPVQARPATALYRLRRFTARHRYGVLAALLVVVSILAGAISTVWQKHMAERRLHQTRELVHYQMFRLHDELSAIAGTTKVRQALVAESMQYLDALAREVSGDAGLQAELAEGYLRLGDVLGNPYIPNLGQTDQARAAYGKGIQLAQPLKDGLGRRAYALLQINLGLLDGFAGRTESAQSLTTSGIAVLREVIRRQPEEAINYFHLGNALAYQGLQVQQQGGLVDSGAQESVRVFQEATAAYEEARRRDPRNPLIRRAMAQLFDRWALRFTSTDPAQAIEWDQRALRVIEELPVAEQSNAAVRKTTASIFSNLGWAQGQLNQFALSQQSSDRALAIYRALASADPEDHRALYDLTGVLRGKGIVYGYAGQKREAIQQFAEAALIHDTLLKDGPNPKIQFLRAELTWRMSDLSSDIGNRAEASRLGRDALNRLHALTALPSPSPTHLREAALFLLTTKATELRNPSEALVYARRAVATRPKDQMFREVLAQALIANAQWGEAQSVATSLADEVRATVKGTKTRQLEEMESLLQQIAVRQPKL